jgi:hypothetical protein
MMEAVRANLFHAAHSAIDDWDTFPWHSHNGMIQTHKVQALALDVFGTIKVGNDGRARRQSRHTNFISIDCCSSFSPFE